LNHLPVTVASTPSSASSRLSALEKRQRIGEIQEPCGIPVVAQRDLESLTAGDGSLCGIIHRRGRFTVGDAAITQIRGLPYDVHNHANLWLTVRFRSPHGGLVRTGCHNHGNLWLPARSWLTSDRIRLTEMLSMFSLYFHSIAEGLSRLPDESSQTPSAYSLIPADGYCLEVITRLMAQTFMTANSAVRLGNSINLTVPLTPTTYFLSRNRCLT
jgi:hypothetical protein